MLSNAVRAANAATATALQNATNKENIQSAQAAMNSAAGAYASLSKEASKSMKKKERMKLLNMQAQQLAFPLNSDESSSEASADGVRRPASKALNLNLSSGLSLETDNADAGPSPRNFLRSDSANSGKSASSAIAEKKDPAGSVGLAMDDATQKTILLAPAVAVAAIRNDRADAIDEILKKAQAGASADKDNNRIANSQSSSEAAATTSATKLDGEIAGEDEEDSDESDASASKSKLSLGGSVLRGIASTSNYAPPSIVLAGERDSGISFGTLSNANEDVARGKASARLLATLENGGRALLIEAALFSHRTTSIPPLVRERFWEGMGSLLIILISLFVISKTHKRSLRRGRRK